MFISLSQCLHLSLVKFSAFSENPVLPQRGIFNHVMSLSRLDLYVFSDTHTHTNPVIAAVITAHSHTHTWAASSRKQQAVIQITASGSAHGGKDVLYKSKLKKQATLFTIISTCPLVCKNQPLLNLIYFTLAVSK